MQNTLWSLYEVESWWISRAGTLSPQSCGCSDAWWFVAYKIVRHSVDVWASNQSWARDSRLIYWAYQLSEKMVSTLDTGNKMNNLVLKSKPKLFGNTQTCSNSVSWKCYGFFVWNRQKWNSLIRTFECHEIKGSGQRELSGEFCR